MTPLLWGVQHLGWSGGTVLELLHGGEQRESCSKEAPAWLGMKPSLVSLQN